MILFISDKKYKGGGRLLTADNLSAIPKTIESILKENPKMKIPLFQRDYSWKKDNWKELWDDINNSMKNNSQHYLGSVVLVKNNDFKDIVDGQQRLTTISIIYLAIISNLNCLINNGIDEHDNAFRVKTIKDLICETNLRNFTCKNKIELNENNNHVYSQYLVNDLIPNEDIENVSNKQLIQCFKYFKKELKKACTKKGEDFPDSNLLIDYYETICEKLILIEIIASDYHNAYVIFETLNDRGVDLTVTDLLKNYLFSKISIEKHQDVKAIWNKIINNVDEKNTTKFIRHYWNSQNKKVTEKGLFKVIKENLKTEGDVFEFLNKLYEISYVYEALSDPKNRIWDGDQKIIKALEEIKLYKVDLCYPVLMAAHSNISDINKKERFLNYVQLYHSDILLFLMEEQMIWKDLTMIYV